MRQLASDKTTTIGAIKTRSCEFKCIVRNCIFSPAGVTQTVIHQQNRDVSPLQIESYIEAPLTSREEEQIPNLHIDVRRDEDSEQQRTRTPQILSRDSSSRRVRKGGHGCKSAPRRLAAGFENVFYHLGFHVASHPFAVIIGCLIAVGVASVGMCFHGRCTMG